MSDGPELDRLGRLEKEVERLSKVASDARSSARALLILLAGLVLLGGGALAVLYDQGKLRLEAITGGVLKTVEAKEFGFYNRQDERVFLIDKDKFGYPNLILMDLKKRYRMGILVFADGDGTPGLVFYDGSGLRGHLRMTGDQASVLKLTGAKQKGSILLSVSADGDPHLIITDKSGKVMFAVPEGATETKPKEAMRQGEHSWFDGLASRPWRLMLFEVNSRLAEESSFMRKSIRRCALEGFAAIGLCAALSLLGCSGSNENERENARTATPGIPAENPNESFGDRRERTRGQSKQLEKIETRAKAAASKTGAGRK